MAGRPRAEDTPATATTALSSREDQKPFGLWWSVMALTLAAALLESWLASRYLGVPSHEVGNLVIC